MESTHLPTGHAGPPAPDPSQHTLPLGIGREACVDSRSPVRRSYPLVIETGRRAAPTRQQRGWTGNSIQQLQP